MFSNKAFRGAIPGTACKLYGAFKPSLPLQWWWLDPSAPRDRSVHPSSPYMRAACVQRASFTRCPPSTPVEGPSPVGREIGMQCASMPIDGIHSEPPSPPRMGAEVAAHRPTGSATHPHAPARRYRTNFDPHLFKWKPLERCTIDFRLTENRQGGHDLLLARPAGKVRGRGRGRVR